MKTCVHCSTEKPTTDFPSNRATLDRLSSWCRSCHRAASLERHYRMYTRRPRLPRIRKPRPSRPPAEIAVRQCVDCGDEYRSKHPHKVRCDPCQTRREHDAGKETVAYLHHVRRVMKGGGRFYRVTRPQVYERDSWMCGLCNRTVDPQLTWPHPLSASIDHIVPVARGGDHSLENLQTAHLVCNLRKGTSGALRGRRAA